MSQKFDVYAAQKELLIMRAQLQRMELSAEVQNLREQFAWMGVLGRVGGFFANRNMSSLGPLGLLGGQFFQSNLKKHPLLGLAASTLLMRFRAPIAKAGLRAGLAALVLAGAVYWFKTSGKTD